MKIFYLAVICAGMALLSGCATESRTDTTMIQGTWKGQEVRDGSAVASWLTLSGNDLDFKSADGKEWYRGTYTINPSTNPKELIVVITDAASTQYAGKTCNAIYEIIPGHEYQDTLVLTGNEPGDPNMPSSFADRHARQIVFTRN